MYEKFFCYTEWKGGYGKKHSISVLSNEKQMGDKQKTLHISVKSFFIKRINNKVTHRLCDEQQPSIVINGNHFLLLEENVHVLHK